VYAKVTATLTSRLPAVGANEVLAVSQQRVEELLGDLIGEEHDIPAGIIREALIKAQKYGEAVERAMGSEEDMPEFDMKSEALLPVLRGEVKAHFHCHRADDIFTAIRIAKEFELDYVLIHCTDGHIIADELAEEEASCVIGPVICDRCKPEMANLTPANAGC
jgi:imidazolonepropionase-like amidohydrolase